MSGSSGKLHRITPLIMLIMMGVVLCIITLQLVLMLHLSLSDIKIWFLRLGSGALALIGDARLRRLYPVFTAFFLFLALSGWIYDKRANNLAKRGLRYRQGGITALLNLLTHRRKLEDRFLHQQHEASLTQEELLRSFLSLLPGQEPFCRELATFLRLRLNRNRPASGVSSAETVSCTLLFVSTSSTSSNTGHHLAQMIGRKLQRPFTSLTFTPSASQSAQKNWARKLKETCRSLEDGVIEIIYRPSVPNHDRTFLRAETEQYIEALLPLWQPDYQAESGNMVIITLILPDETEEFSIADITAHKAGIEAFLSRHDFLSPLIPFCDRIFPFPPLKPLDMAAIAARGIEETIKTHGLSYETGGIDPYILLQWQKDRQEHAHPAIQNITRPEDLQHAVEEQIGEDLVRAMQQHKPYIRLMLEDGRLIVIASTSYDQRLTPVSGA